MGTPDLTIDTHRAIDTLLRALEESVEKSRPAPVAVSDCKREQLETQLRHMDVVLEQLTTTISQRKIQLKRDWNSHVPIHKLSIELLTRDFAASADKDMDRYVSLDEDEGNTVGRLVQPAVAKHWRDILLGVPQLWSTIRPGCRGMALAIERSQGVPLHITYSRRSRTPYSDQDLIWEVAPLADRWKSLRWRGRPLVVETVLKEHPAPSLELLDLEILEDFGGTLLQYTLTENLRTLLLDRVFVPWPAEGLPQLTAFALGSLPCPSLHTMPDLFAFLASSPRLQQIVFTDLGSDRPLPVSSTFVPIARPVLTFPSLLYLSFDRVTETVVADFLQAASTPKLKNISLETGFDYDLADDTIVDALIAGRNPDSPLTTILKKVVGREIYVEVSPQAVQLAQFRMAEDERLGFCLSFPHKNWLRNLGRLVTTTGHPTTLYFRDTREFDTTTNLLDAALHLDWISKVAHVYATYSVNICKVLDALSTAKFSENGDGVAWPCPSLAEVDLTQEPRIGMRTRDDIIEKVRMFLERRSGVKVYDAEGNLYEEGAEGFMASGIVQ